MESSCRPAEVIESPSTEWVGLMSKYFDIHDILAEETVRHPLQADTVIDRPCTS